MTADNAVSPHSPLLFLESPSRRFGMLVLPVVATGTSIGVSVLAGLERGGTLNERVVWVFIGIVMLLCAHLILALTRGQHLLVKLPAVLLWICSMVGTGYGHATFFLEAQRHAGDVRAASMQHELDVGPAVQVGRDPAAIAADRAKVEERLAVLKARKCAAPCAILLAYRSEAQSQIQALNVEFDEARRREQKADVAASDRQRTVAKQDALRDDPVTEQIARLCGVSRQSVDIAVALAFGWLLEGIACIGWLLALGSSKVIVPVCAESARLVPVAAAVAPVAEVTSLRSEPATAVPAEMTRDGASAVTSSEQEQSSNERDEAPTDVDIEVAPGVSDRDLSRLAEGVARGEVRATVADVRRFFSCSQARALKLRKAFWESMQDARPVMTAVS